VKEKQSKLEKAVTNWVRAEIASRFSQFVRPDLSKESQFNFGNMAGQEMLKYEDEIRRIVFGTDCFVKIAEKLGMFKAPNPEEDKKYKRKKNRKKKLKVGKRAKLKG